MNIPDTTGYQMTV